MFFHVGNTFECEGEIAGKTLTMMSRMPRHARSIPAVPPRRMGPGIFPARFVGRLGGLVPLLVFILLCSLEGSAFIATIGPLTMPDTNMHLTATYALATGQSFNGTRMVATDDGDKRAQVLTGDARYLEASSVRSTTIEGIGVTSLTMDSSYSSEVKALDSDTRGTVTTTARSNQYLFLPYVPQAIGFRLGLDMGWTPSATVKAARVSNLLGYMLMIGAAIMLASRARWLFVVFGLLPVPVFCASSIMADASAIGFTALFVALSLHVWQRREPLPWWRVGLLAVAGAVQCLVKYAYAPVILLPLAASHGMDRRRRTVYLAGVALLALPLLVWWQETHAFVIRPDLYETNTGLFASDWWGSTLVVLSNALVATFDAVESDGTLMLSLLLLLAVFTLRRRDPRDIGEPERDGRPLWAASCVVAVLSLVLVWLSLFLTWTDFSDDSQGLRIDGFQMRYLYPLIPLLAGAWYGRGGGRARRTSLAVSGDGG